MEPFCLGRGRVVDDTIHEKREGYLKYLTLLARDRPDHYVCKVLGGLLPVDQHDLPREQFSPSHPLGRRRWSSIAYGPGSESRLDERHLAIDHRHVHLALKYARIQSPYYWSYLKTLLKPYHAEYSPYCKYRAPPSKTKSWGTLIKDSKVEYSAFPKIVRVLINDNSESEKGELRFLSMSTWLYHLIRRPTKESKRRSGFGERRDVSNDETNPPKLRQAVGNLRICPHIQTCRPNCPDHGLSDDRSDSLGLALDIALHRIGNDTEMESIKVEGACQRCPTDFQTWVLRGRLPSVPSGGPTSEA